jgi:hypothetical protein
MTDLFRPRPLTIAGAGVICAPASNRAGGVYDGRLHQFAFTSARPGFLGPENRVDFTPLA